MKGISIAFSLLILTSCTAYKSYESNDYFSSIPLKPNTHKVDLYFGSETPIDSAYTEIKTIAITRKGSNQRSKILSQALAAKARREGLDAVVGIGREDFSEENYTFGDFLCALSGEYTEPSFAYYGELFGVGIKYHKYINYLDELVKTEKAFLFENNKEVPLFTAYINPKGILDSLIAHHELASEIHDNLHYAYSKQHLVQEKTNWRYKQDIEIITRRQQFKFIDWPLKTVFFFYDRYQRITRLKIKHHETFKKEIITFEYIKNSNLVSIKRIIRIDKSQLKEVFSYDENLRITSKTVYRVYDSGKEERFYKVKYQYYRNDYLPHLLAMDSIKFERELLSVE